MKYKIQTASLIGLSCLTTTACFTDPIVGNWDQEGENSSCVGASYTYTGDGYSVSESVELCFNLQAMSFDVLSEDYSGVFEGELGYSYTETYDDGSGAETESDNEIYAMSGDAAISLKEDSYDIDLTGTFGENDEVEIELDCTLTSKTELDCDISSFTIDDEEVFTYLEEMVNDSDVSNATSTIDRKLTFVKVE